VGLLDARKRRAAKQLIRAIAAGALALGIMAPAAVGALLRPANLILPAISGKAQVGRTLKASPGSWSGSPTSYAYRWKRCDSSGSHCVAISGADSSRYVLTRADRGSTVRLTVIAYNAAGRSSARSAPTAVVAVEAPLNTSPPKIAGVLRLGATLAASAGSWSGSPTSYAYHWERCNSRGQECAGISGATLPSYLIAPRDVGATLRVSVTASNGAGRSSATSSPTGVIEGLLGGTPAHVMVIVEENRDRSEVIGSPSMPYLNSLATTYGNTAAWQGIGHPSLPNYLALISGSTLGVTDDGCGYSFSGVPTLGAQLTLAGIGWKAYLEGLPSAGSTTCESGEYVKKHNPFAYFPQTNGPNVVPASQFASDLSAGKLPPFAFYVPNECNDGHDCSNTIVDKYLKGLIPAVLASAWYAENGTIIITYDEAVGEGKIPTVVVHGSGDGRTLAAAGDHYGTLATIEDLYGVPRLGRAALATTTLAPLVK